MIRYLRNRSSAKALEAALARYDALLEGGTDVSKARSEAISALPADVRTAFALATALRDTPTLDVPEPAFAAAFEARLRSATMVRRPVAPRPRLQLASRS